MSPIREGALIRGKYRVERVLGQGGMGVVVAARHLSLEQRVAIKLLQPELLAHPEFVERFLREARAASRLESDHVVRVTDVDTLENGAPFMVMEWLDGHDLSSVRRSGRPLRVAEAVGHVLDACRGVAEAHAAGIVHRDLKPANLFLAKRRDGTERVKVLDFGISKTTSPDSNTGLTSTTAVMGSAEYMSPEQMMSTRDVDVRSDIWALGVILYELCTATVPFPGETITQVCARVMTVEPTSPRAIRADLPPGLDAVILRCLRRNREERFASVRDLVAALAPFAQDSDAVPRTLASPVAFGATEIASSGSAAARSAAPAIPPTSQGHVLGAAPRAQGPAIGALTAAPQKTKVWPFAVAGALVIAGGAAFGVTRFMEDDPPPKRRATLATTTAATVTSEPNPADPGPVDGPARPGPEGPLCGANDVDTGCPANETRYVQLATVPETTPETYDFPLTQALLKERQDFSGIRLVDASHKGHRILAAITRNRCQADKLAALANERMKSGAASRCGTIDARRTVAIAR